MTKTRRLTDLYVRGKELSPDDGSASPVRVWMAKLNELDREAALRRANAAKARYLIDTDDEDGDTFAAAYATMREFMSRDVLVDFVTRDDIARARQRIEAECSVDEETWAKDDYLQGLHDAWVGDDDNPGLAATQIEDPDDPEVQRVERELKRFEAEVERGVELEVERVRKDWADVPIDDLRRKATHTLLELQANQAFVKEFRRQKLFYAVRDIGNRHRRYFASVSEVDDLDDELRDYLSGQFDALAVDRTEGKDSPPPEDSSNSSGSADPASTPTTVTA